MELFIIILNILGGALLCGCTIPGKLFADLGKYIVPPLAGTEIIGQKTHSSENNSMSDRVKADLFEGELKDLYPQFMQQHPPIKLESGGLVFKWAGGIVPYYIDTKSYDSILQAKIKVTMAIIERLSCIEFKQLAEEPQETDGFTYVIFTNPQGKKECSHKVKQGQNGQATMVLGYDCMRTRHLIHSLFHVLGLQDEVTHPERDHHIRILWKNIQPKYLSLFQIDKNVRWPAVEYDGYSVMQFHELAFSANGAATIIPKVSGLQIKPSELVSKLDLTKLSATYDHECRKRQVGNFLSNCNDCPYMKGNQKINEGEDENVSELKELDNNGTSDGLPHDKHAKDKKTSKLKEMEQNGSSDGQEKHGKDKKASKLKELEQNGTSDDPPHDKNAKDKNASKLKELEQNGTSDGPPHDKNAKDKNASKLKELEQNGTSDGPPHDKNAKDKNASKLKELEQNGTSDGPPHDKNAKDKTVSKLKGLEKNGTSNAEKNKNDKSLRAFRTPHKPVKLVKFQPLRRTYGYDHL